jgi:hypothetical protein
MGSLEAIKKQQRKENRKKLQAMRKKRRFIRILNSDKKVCIGCLLVSENNVKLRGIIENNGKVPMIYSFFNSNAWQEIEKGDPILEKEKDILERIKRSVDVDEKERVKLEKRTKKIFATKAVL